MVIGLEFTGHIAQSIFDETVSLVLAEIYMALSLTVGAVVQPLTLNAFEYTGGVANTVSAYLQTKGLIDQGKILADFEKLRWIAALAWLFAVSLAVGSIAVFGNYRQGLYLLIGPPLFYYMTTTTLETDGTQLRFGDRVVPGAPAEQKQMLTWIRTIGGEMDPDTGEITGAGTAKVSFFFGVFDTMVTEAVHKLVTLAVNTAKADDLRFVARERILNYLLHSTPIDEGFTKLLGTAYYGECSNIQDDIQRTFTLEKKAWIKLRPIEDLKKSDEHRKKVDAQKQVDPGYSEKAFLLAMKKEGVPEFSDVPDWQSAAAHGPSVSCEQLWKWVGGACKRLAADKIKAESLRDVAGEKMTEEYWLKAWNDAVAWLARTMAPVGGAQTEDEKARDALATYILKNGMQKSSIDALTTGVFSRSPFNSREYDTIAGPLARAEAHGGYFRLKYFAYSVPYIQGLLLYLLCIAFPFFSVFLVLPGKAPAFFVWCSLWVWVKSWDVGFALIHVFRDIMWHMLGERANIHGTEIDWANPVSIMSVIYHNDPYMGQNAYWEMVSALTVAVPLLTAHLCLGATGLYNMFKGGIDQTTERFGMAETNRSKRFIGNVNEDLRKRREFEVSSEFAKQAEQQIATGQGGADALTTATGDSLFSFGGTRAYATALNFLKARHLVYFGSPNYTGTMQSDIKSAVASEAQAKTATAAGKPAPSIQTHPLRGTMSTDSVVQPEALRRLYGSLEGAYMTLKPGATETQAKQWAAEMTAAEQQGKEKGQFAGLGPKDTISWQDVFTHEAAYQQHGQAALGAITSRHMDLPTRTEGSKAQNMVSLAQHLALMRRDPEASADANRLLGVNMLVDLFSGKSASGQAGIPGVEGNAGTNPFSMKTD